MQFHNNMYNRADTAASEMLFALGCYYASVCMRSEAYYGSHFVCAFVPRISVFFMDFEQN